MKKITTQLRWKQGLIPAVIQDNMTRQVLMLAYMNKTALRKTIKTKRVWFYSRSKKRLWMKGEESGNTLSVVDCQVDCDGDALLVSVNPMGPTCHTGQISCFNDSTRQEDTLADLYKIIEGRKRAMPKGSYTSSLFHAGLDTICAKVAEESGEVIKAARKESKRRLREEAVDVLYHVFVLCAARGIRYNDLLKEFIKREK